MFTFLFIVTVLVFTSLVIVAAMRPVYSAYSITELERRSKQTAAYKRELQRQKLLGDIQTLLRAACALLFVVTVLLLVATFGWFFGTVFAVLVALLYPAVARLRLFTKAGWSLYDHLEPHLLHFVTQFHGLFLWMRETPFYHPEQYHRFDSREELAELIENAPQEVLDKDERTLISTALVFRDKTVASVMTPRTVIDSIKKAEFLGPLVLDELSSLGHSRLPVIDKDLNHIVGILHLRDLLSLDVRRSVTAEKAMEPKVYYIHQEDTLEHALAAFLKTRHHLFIVINGERETVGLLTLEDVLEALIGRRIVDEDDVHDDLRAVAQREAKDNNAAPGHVDL